MKFMKIPASDSTKIVKKYKSAFVNKKSRSSNKQKGITTKTLNHQKRGYLEELRKNVSLNLD